MDVSYSDWDDFRRRRAVDISSYHSETSTMLICIDKQYILAECDTCFLLLVAFEVLLSYIVHRDISY